MDAQVEPRTAHKVAFLSDPRTYPEPTSKVEAVETNMSWVFLTDAHAWKLKKPDRVDGVDLATVEARREHCRLELKLNRRLSADVYLDVVPLSMLPGGGLVLGGPAGLAVDWLVKMRRLPAALMLDRRLAAGLADPRDARRIAGVLARFHAACPVERVTGAEYRAGLAERIDDACAHLLAFPSEAPADRVAALSRELKGFLARAPDLFDRRVEAGRVVEGHGDLRPEHICLTEPPRILDCLEFSRALRVADAASEVGFLALECERLGAARFACDLLDAYGVAARDAPDERLVHFHQGLHAGLRAWIALRHLRHPRPRDPARWEPLAREYLALAAAHAARCAG